jgi:hypothetical protein
VEAGGDCAGADGSPDLPFCDVQQAVTVAGGSRSVIIVRAGSYPPFTVFDKQLLVIGRGTEQAPAGIVLGPTDETRVTIEGGAADVTIRNLVVSGATDVSGLGISCRQGAICRIERCEITNNGRGVFAAGERLEVRRTFVRGHLYGGIETAATAFVIENSVLFQNGSSATSFGGASLGNSLPGDSRIFRYNTLSENFSNGTTGSSSSVVCEQPTTLTSSIFWENEDAPTSDCAIAYSVIDDPVVGSMPTNTAQDPLFEPPPSRPLHPGIGSSAIGLGDPNDVPAIDADGAVRDADPDSGAYEYVP